MIKKVIIVGCLVLSFTSHVMGADMSLQESRKKRIVDVFNGLNKDTMSILDGFYHPELKFEDPLGQINGLKDMKAYYANMYKSVKSIRFEFSEIIGGENGTFVGIWRMYLAAPVLNGGKEYWVEGNSLIRFDEKSDLVIYHRDYFDMGAFIYEQLPIVKSLIKTIRSQFEHKSK